jgi:uncharacterized protein with FMN-binding domain
MKRAVATFVATIAGLVLLLDFKTHASRLSSQTALGTAASSTPVPENSPVASSPPTPGVTSAAPPANSPAAATSAPAAPAAAKRAVTGASVRTHYGDVQVQVVYSGNQITDVVPLRLPDSNSLDQEIDQQAVPILIQETLDAQGANIQAVSGATYTSDGYIRSLQSALDKKK